ncbi:MAG: hypothetical protein IT458_01000 [Planctomycetes bacterium]|nr:hypothetical protein [Planctomycetota bacterium]
MNTILLGLVLLSAVTLQDPDAKAPSGRLAKAAAALGAQEGKARRIAGGSEHTFAGVSYDLPRGWSPKAGADGTELVPPGATPGGVLEEKYMLLRVEDLDALEGEDADDAVQELADAVHEGLEAKGRPRSVTLGEFPGRVWSLAGAGPGGRVIAVRVHGFRAGAKVCAVVALGFADTLLRRDVDLAAILASLRPAGPAPRTKPEPRAEPAEAAEAPQVRPAGAEPRAPEEGGAATPPAARTPLPGGTAQRFRGVAFDLPKGWRMQDGEQGTLLVPADANPDGVLEEAYVLVADPETRALDGAAVEAQVEEAIQQLQPGVTRQGKVQKVRFGEVDGRLYVFTGSDPAGRRLEVRVHGFLGQGAACALVALGYQDVLARRARTLQAVLASMAAPKPGAPGESRAELAGQWAYLANFNATNGGGSMTSTTLTLGADGSYVFHAVSSSSNPFGSVAGETRHSGTWRATADSLTLVGSDGAEHTYALVKRNHPQNRQDPMIVLDGRAFVTATPRRPW